MDKIGPFRAFLSGFKWVDDVLKVGDNVIVVGDCG